MNLFSRRTVLLLTAIMFVVVLPISIGLAWNYINPMPKQPVVTDQHQGFALGTAYTKRCSSPATNPSPDRAAQLAFLDEHQVTVTTSGDPGFETTWLDFWVPETIDGQQSLIAVRYFAGANDEHPCTFGLVTPGNHREVGAAAARYTLGGPPYNLPEGTLCTSTVPPVLSQGTPSTAGDKVTVATIRCDNLDG